MPVYVVDLHDGAMIPFIDGNLNVVGDIVYDEVNGRNIYISGLSTFVGVSTFQSAVGFRTDVFISGMTTVVGVATFRDNVFIDYCFAVFKQE